MKKIFLSAAVAALMILLTVSCEKTPSFVGDDVRFAVSSASSGPVTKTSYSGQKTGIKERIDWVAEDIIRVYNDLCYPHYADYKVDGSTIQDEGAVSSAKVRLSSPNGIKWGEGENTFYAVYPSPGTLGKSADELGNGTMKGTIPAVQKPLSLNDASPYIAVPDMTNQYMVAKTTDTYADGKYAVSLAFTPITTTIQFTIKNGYGNDGDMKIKKISLVSEKTDISGNFSADLSGWSDGYPTCQASGSDGTKTVVVDFTDGGTKSDDNYVTVKKDGTLTFTAFLRPTSDVDDLTFKITRDDDTWISLKLMSEGKPITFHRCKKTFVSGLLIPEGTQWVVKYEPDVVNWNVSGIDDDLDLDFSETPEMPF